MLERKITKRRKIYGVGINDADYFTQYHLPNGDKFRCPYYVRWTGMLCRAYNKKYHEKFPTYIGCSVCDEWLTFSNFQSWMEKQDWKDKQLDKDLLGDGKIYSPENCAFVLGRTNMFFTNCKEINLTYLKHRNVFRVKCGDTTGDNEVFLGDYSSYEDGLKVWENKKEEFARNLSEIETDERIKLYLLNFKFGE